MLNETNCLNSTKEHWWAILTILFSYSLTRPSRWQKRTTSGKTDEIICIWQLPSSKDSVVSSTTTRCPLNTSVSNVCPWSVRIHLMYGLLSTQTQRNPDSCSTQIQGTENWPVIATIAKLQHQVYIVQIEFIYDWVSAKMSSSYCMERRNHHHHHMAKMFLNDLQLPLQSTTLH